MTRPKKLSQKELQAFARAEGLSVASTTGLAPLENSVKPLNDWQRAGYAGEMSYMLRPPELLCQPLKLCPQARSVASFAVLYEQSAVPECPPGEGRVARYAWGNDYHTVLKARLSGLVAALEAHFQQAIVHRVFSDSVPLLERALAERAGLGFVGKNSLLIRPGTGSLFFLAEVLWDVEVTPDSLPAASGSCGTCRRCMRDCPTEAIVAERVIDSRRCISYLTIEKRGSFSTWERKALGEWIFGCDVCQEVCPFNHASIKRQSAGVLPEFRSVNGVGPCISLKDVLNLRTSEGFRKRFAKSPLLRPKRAGLLRNAACVAANTLAEECVPVLIESAQSDCDAIVREHAIWALAQFRSAGGLGPSIATLCERALKDPDSKVQEEAKAYLENRERQ